MLVTLDAEPVGTDEIADWIELLIFKSKLKGVNTQKLFSAVNEQLGFEEHTFALAINTIMKRSQLIQSYPFLVDEVALIMKDDAYSSIYTMLLLLSRPTNLMSWQTTTPSQDELDVFESIVCIALCNYLGNDSEALPFGWPSKFGRPENFNEAIIWLASKIGVATGPLYRSPRRKDGGVDIVIWRRFSDNRTGFQIGLVQCTLQQNYVAKSRDIDLRLWSGWLQLERDPITFLAIPKSVPGDEHWNEASANSIVFERVRLAQFYMNELDEQMGKVLQKTLAKLRV